MTPAVNPSVGRLHLDRQPESLRVVGLAWMRQARCGRFDDDYADTLFHPTRSGTVPQSPRRHREAARTCLLCPVRAECLAHALYLETIQYELSGVWAGTSQAEREATAHSDLCRSRDRHAERAERYVVLGLTEREARAWEDRDRRLPAEIPCAACVPREDRMRTLDAVARSKAAQSLAPWEAVA
jgi:WhiB family redox-sensing transcriptional regulator